MSRQQTVPILLSTDGAAVPLIAETLGPGGDLSEDDVQALVHDHPAVLSIGEIDSAFANAIPICRELPTAAGPIDNFLVTPEGLPVLVECKLWRNPQGRREVVGQILEYAKELARWTSADVQRAVAQRLGGGPDALITTLRAQASVPDEAAFHDALSRNLRHGRCLLLIVGDGIREGAEAIFDYLGDHAALQFSLGLVELPVFRMPDGTRLVAPRVLARTAVHVREVIRLPEGLALAVEDGATTDMPDPETVALGDERQAFWRGFLDQLDLDDPEQPIPPAPRQGWIAFNMPGPRGKCRLVAYRYMQGQEVGLFTSFTVGSTGESIVRTLAKDWDVIGEALGNGASLGNKDGRPRIKEARRVGDLTDPNVQNVARRWLAERTNAFVNVLRPRIRAIADDLADE